MSDTEFTKGEWQLVTCGNKIDIWSGDESITGGIVFEFPSSEDTSRVIANHSLIVAAPDMYALLVEFVKSVENDCSDFSMFAVKNLLKKARGES